MGAELAGRRRMAVDVAVKGGRGARRRRVEARIVPLAEALPWLAGLPAEESLPTSLLAWSAAVKAGLNLVAKGRLHPSISRAGFDTWKVGPLDRRDEEWVATLAAALPLEAHALPVAQGSPLLVRSPEAILRECWDAIADALVRSPAAGLTTAHRAYAVARPTSVEPLREWLEAAETGLGTGARPELRLESPDGEGDGFEAVLQLRSRQDPSLVVGAEDLWEAPSAVLRWLGESAEVDLLLALRRGARAWPPLEPLLEQARPARMRLGEAQVAELLGPAAQDLAAQGLEVLWPAELVFGDLELRAALAPTPGPKSAGEPTFTLDQVLEFRWELALGGEVLTAEEVEQLATAKRPLLRLRGRLVRADPELLARIRARRPGRIGAREALATALGGSLRIGDEEVSARVEGPAAALADRLRELGSGSREAAEPEGLLATLRPYQRRGLAWLLEMSETGLGGCLADDMGLGKTVQMIALQLARGRGPMLVVCPASLLGNWEREVRRFAPGLVVRRYHGSGRSLDSIAGRDVVLASYGVARRDAAALSEVGWDLAVADEAQHAKNPLSKTARALREIPARVRVALTGTPVENRLSDLWSILDWTTPGLLGPLDAFRRRVAVPIERYRDEEAAARFGRIVRPFLLRRRKSDPAIAPELPAKTEMDVVVPMTPEQITLYEAAVREALDQIARSQGMERRGLVFKMITALKQICNHPAQYLKETGPLDGRSGKLEGLLELLEVIAAEGDATLVFSQYVAMARLIERRLAADGTATLFLHGGVEPARRDELVARFQAGGAAVFLLSLKAGGVGLNLTRATQVVHFDRWWNPAVEDQATDRAYRIGQDRPVQVRRLVTEGTIEDRIAAVMATKRQLADAVVGAGEAWISELSDRELKDLVELRVL
ncbi:MAG: DEAD/DEAH box helicase [Candidatus Dormibacterales bacterium]